MSQKKQGHPQVLNVWEFYVKPESVPDFRRFNGIDGIWHNFFSKRSDDYIDSCLWPDPSREFVFTTADHWRSEAAFKAFIDQYQTEYAQLSKVHRELMSEDPVHKGHISLGIGTMPHDINAAIAAYSADVVKKRKP
ncbi:hypothetical protein H8D36_05490 [archaeon]|nr:hypothetical protein [archaeon]MBL7057295.1 hypothetical protein [Candidatus Woesearchaeota archaeon]